MHEVPHYEEIGRTPVYNTPVRRDYNAEKVRWDTQVRECLRMLTTLQLVSEEPESMPDIDPVNMLHHTIASLGALSLSITQSRRVAVDQRLEVEKPGSTPLFAEAELKLLKHKDTLNHKLRAGQRIPASNIPASNIHVVVMARDTRFVLRKEIAKVKGRAKATINPSTRSVLQRKDVRQ